MSEPRRHGHATTMKDAALGVIKTLREAGFEALFAGGCVRDKVMGKEPHDFDVATSAPPDRILALFRRTRKVGIQFGVVLVGVKQFWIEVATFRSDGAYRDGRHPEKIQFTDAREDALRRDFTINGMFFDPLAGRVIDYVGGEADIRQGLIRAIGDAAQRFNEDHLRLIRAVRFAARFGFEIEPATAQAIRDLSPLIRKISAERIHDELERILTHPNRARGFAMLRSSQLLQHLWHGADEVLPTADRTQAMLAALPPGASFELGLAALLHALAPARVEEVCRLLMCSNRTLKSTVWLVSHQEDLTRPAEVTLADLKLLMACRPFAQLLDLLAARQAARDESPAVHAEVVARANAIPSDEIAPPAFITGKHLGKLGLPPGPEYKSILERVYYAQLNGDLTDRHAARNMARRLISELPRPSSPES